MLWQMQEESEIKNRCEVWDEAIPGRSRPALGAQARVA
jgi:hypothetical protein